VRTGRFSHGGEQRGAQECYRAGSRPAQGLRGTYTSPTTPTAFGPTTSTPHETSTSIGERGLTLPPALPFKQRYKNRPRSSRSRRPTSASLSNATPTASRPVLPTTRAGEPRPSSSKPSPTPTLNCRTRLAAKRTTNCGERTRVGGPIRPTRVATFGTISAAARSSSRRTNTTRRPSRKTLSARIRNTSLGTCLRSCSDPKSIGSCRSGLGVAQRRERSSALYVLLPMLCLRPRHSTHSNPPLVTDYGQSTRGGGRRVRRISTRRNPRRQGQSGLHSLQGLAADGQGADPRRTRQAGVWDERTVGPCGRCDWFAVVRFSSALPRLLVLM
jgi:hypothetical protein